MACEHCAATGDECGVCRDLPALTVENAGARVPYGWASTDLPDGPATGPALTRLAEVPARDLGAAIRRGRQTVGDLRAELAEAEADLARLLKQAGRRPGDGSDQGRLFEPAAQTRLW